VVLCLSSPDRLYHDWQRARTRPLRDGGPAATSHLDSLLKPGERGLPVVAVIDGASHALAWLGSALGTRCVPLGVDRFGQTGSQPELYAEYCVGAAAITTAALVALEP
jgi:pyruvate dehydrogenase E1 component